jgi:hypothetical protein
MKKYGNKGAWGAEYDFRISRGLLVMLHRKNLRFIRVMRRVAPTAPATKLL